MWTDLSDLFIQRRNYLIFTVKNCYQKKISFIRCVNDDIYFFVISIHEDQILK